MNKKMYNSQIDNLNTFIMKKNQLISMAENVLIYENMPKEINISYFNRKIVRNGSIAFFYDEILKKYLTLPITKYGILDVYGEPTSIVATGSNGYNRELKKGEFVIIYDNLSRKPLYSDIIQYAERLALMTRTIDLNINQQKIGRVWVTTEEKEKSLQDLLNRIDTFQEYILTYEGLLDKENSYIIAEPVPFIADKIQESYEKLYNEFLMLIGVANTSVIKKERVIKDEIQNSNSGSILNRYSRFEARKEAFEKIKEIWGLDVKIAFYDGLPTNLKDFENQFEKENNDEGGFDNYV